MNNIIKTFENQKIINKKNSIRNKALKTLFNFDMSDDLVSVFGKSLYYVSDDDMQMLIEVDNKDVKGIEIINGNEKYTIINNSKEEMVGINVEALNNKPFFITHFCSLKNDSIDYCYDYIDIITMNKNIFDFNNKEKDKTKVKTLAK